MKNIASKTILLFIFISLAACGKSLTVGLGGGGLNNNNQRPPVALIDQTDMSLCKGQSKNPSIAGETWMLYQKAGNYTQTQGLVLDGDTNNPNITYTVTCMNAKSQPLVASVQVTGANDKVGSVLHHGAAQKIVGSTRTPQCTAAIDNNPSPYALVGNCLKITINNGTHYFVRASRLFLNF